MAQHLVEHGMSVGFYHADMDASVREQVHRAWTKGKACFCCKLLALPLSPKHSYLRLAQPYYKV